MEVDERLLEYLREPEVQKHLATGDFLGVYVGLMYTRFAYLGSQLTELLYAAGIDPLQSMKVIPLNFLDCSVYKASIEEVDIPIHIEKIGARAFFYSKIRHITIPGDLIGRQAFQGCYQLEFVDILEGMKTIESQAFNGCKNLKVIKLPASLTHLGTKVFTDCPKLKTIAYAGTTKMWAETFSAEDFKSRLIIQCVDGDLKSDRKTWELAD